MIKGLFFLLVILALAAGIGWVADQPGLVSLVWLDWQVETTTPVLAGAVFVLILLAVFLYRFWVSLKQVPRVIGAAWKRDRRRKGYLALTRGMVAIAAGDAGEAGKNAKRARTMLSDPPLTLLLEAQAAQLNGDGRAAEKFFTLMLDDPEMAFLGLRGLYNQALSRDDRGAALGLARRAQSLKPKSDWAANAVFELETRAGNWLKAEEGVKASARKRLLGADESRRSRAVLERMQSAEAIKKGDREGGLVHAKKAVDLAPSFAPAVAHYAGLLIGAGNQKKARGVIEKAWKLAPYPDLARLYGEASDASDAVAVMGHMERLGKTNPNHVETHLALAAAAARARLWGEARRHLGALGLDDKDGSDADARAFGLMADVLVGEGAPGDQVRHWLGRAARAPGRRTWVCDSCGNTLDEWTALCARCGDFDSFRFGPPPRVIAGEEGGPDNN